MNAKEKPTYTLDHPEVARLALRLRQTRDAMNALKEVEEKLKKEIPEILADYGLGVFHLPRLDVEVSERTASNLNKDLLVEAGVRPSVVEKGYKRTKYIQVDVKERT